MRKHYAELYPVVKSGFTVAVGKSYGTKGKPQAFVSWYAQYGRIAIAILFWLRHNLPVQYATPVIRPASFSN